MRVMALFATLLTAGSALASFDLLLVADSANNVVHRYDGDSGTYLGNFGSGLMTSIRGVAVDKNTKTAYVVQQNGYTAWDYNTGQFKKYVDALGNAITDLSVNADGSLLATVSLQTTTPLRRIVNPLGSITIQNYNTPAAFPPATSAAQGSDGRFIIMDGLNGNWAIFSPGGGPPDLTGTASSMTGTSKGDFDGGAFIALTAAGATRRLQWGSNSVYLGFALPTPFTSSVEFATGHPGEGWGLGVNASGTRSQKYSRSGSGSGNFYDPVGSGRTLSQVGTPVGIAVVTAPEPGTLLALGAGALALLRKRRRA